MKKIILLFLASFNEVEKVPTLKEKIIEYLGNRMISNKFPEYPALELCQELTSEDRLAIVTEVEKFGSQSLSVAVINNVEENFLNRFIFDLNYEV